MKKRGATYLLLLLSFFATSALAQFPKREFRGVWVATVANIDWPSESGLSSHEQQKEFIALLDMHKANGMNAVIVQVRPSADAFYPSSYEPWSAWLSGKLGNAPSPYYDPLKFMIDETHQRGMEFHAWFNPYRAAVDIEKKGIDSSSVAHKNPEWFLKYGSNLYFDPGLPQARKHTIKVIMEVANKYNIDAVHFDDYFYPYKIKDLEFPDSISYKKYGAAFQVKDDWRRNNVNLFIQELSDTIKKVKPHLQFGISPFSVWRNQEKDSTGSASQAGQTCYDDLYADIVLWMHKGWIDYVLPQLYFSTGFEKVRYDVMADWWNKNNYGVPVYIGQAAYRVGNHSDEYWKQPNQLPKQIRINRKLQHVKGSAFFSSKSFNTNSLGMIDSLRELYKFPALTPAIKRADYGEVKEYSIQFFAIEKGIQLMWNEFNSSDSLSVHNRYVIYRFKKGESFNFSDPSKIIKILPSQNELNIQTYIDSSAKRREKYRYVITSINRFNQESQPNFAYPIISKKKFWKTYTPEPIK